MATVRVCALNLCEHGAQIFPGLIGPQALVQLEEVFLNTPDQPGARITRNPMLQNWIDIRSSAGTLSQSILGHGAKAVRAILFNKDMHKNWALGWHQDRTIAVQERVEVVGFTNWTVKNGITHVEPPFEYLERMLTMRIHLDSVDQDNAPLLVCVGSHRNGRVMESEISEAVRQNETIECLAVRGDVWAYRTTILHASEASRRPSARRVLQVDFSADSLPDELEWAGVG